jgi:acyl transferase domain-containing protein
VEANSIASVFAKHRSATDPLLIGSVKTNIGHLEPASGFAAIIKIVLAFEQGRIPPSINFESPNSKLDLDAMHLKVRFLHKEEVKLKYP